MILPYGYNDHITKPKERVGLDTLITLKDFQKAIDNIQNNEGPGKNVAVIGASGGRKFSYQGIEYSMNDIVRCYLRIVKNTDLGRDEDTQRNLTIAIMGRLRNFNDHNQIKTDSISPKMTKLRLTMSQLRGRLFGNEIDKLEKNLETAIKKSVNNRPGTVQKELIIKCMKARIDAEKLLRKIDTMDQKIEGLKKLSESKDGSDIKGIEAKQKIKILLAQQRNLHEKCVGKFKDVTQLLAEEKFEKAAKKAAAEKGRIILPAKPRRKLTTAERKELEIFRESMHRPPRPPNTPDTQLNLEDGKVFEETAAGEVKDVFEIDQSEFSPENAQKEDYSYDDALLEDADEGIDKSAWSEYKKTWDDTLALSKIDKKRGAVGKVKKNYEYNPAKAKTFWQPWQNEWWKDVPYEIWRGLSRADQEKCIQKWDECIEREGGELGVNSHQAADNDPAFEEKKKKETNQVKSSSGKKKRRTTGKQEEVLTEKDPIVKKKLTKKLINEEKIKNLLRSVE
jgi:hypothetical protein